MKFARTICTAALAALLAAAPLAIRPSAWKIDTSEEFLEGRLSGLSVLSDGRLRLAPPCQELSTGTDPYVLSAARDASGNVYWGTGHEGKVYRLDAGSDKPRMVFDAEEPDVFALAPAGDGSLYVAAGPGGKIYRVEPGGAHRLVVTIGCKYVWALAAGKDGALYAGTGTEGKIFRIMGDKFEVVYDSADTHIMSLAWTPDGDLVAGTAPRGYVLRLSPDGKKVQSLFDAPFQEIRQLSVDRYGAVYALGVGPEVEEERVSSAAEGTGESAPAVLFSPEPKRRRGRPEEPEQRALTSAIIRIDRDLSVKTVWSSPFVRAYSFLVEDDGALKVGTGDRGRILGVEARRVVCTLVECGQEQVTALVPQANGFLAFTSNLGRVFRVGSGAAERGDFISDPQDAAFMSRLGAVTIRTATGAPATGVTIQARSGNTREPDDTWTAWSAPGMPGSRPEIPPARYLQLKVTILRAADGSSPADVDSVETVYMAQNQPPRIQSFTVNPLGVVFQEQAAMAPQTGLPEYGDHSTFVVPEAISSAVTRLGMLPQLPRVFRSGCLSFSWTATDANDDPLEYRLFARKAGSAQWRQIAGPLRAAWANLDKDVLEDGIYTFRLLASDAPGNLPADSREEDALSRLVTVDTHPPAVEVKGVAFQGGILKAEVEATDALSNLLQAEYSLDGGRTWAVLAPSDGLSDSPHETYRLEVGAQAGSSLVVRVLDTAGNVGIGGTELP